MMVGFAPKLSCFVVVFRELLIALLLLVYFNSFSSLFLAACSDSLMD